MSMFILNSKLNERYPTVLDGLVYTYPFDGEKHCCIENLRYAKVLRIDEGSDELYKYFQSKGSIITTRSLNLENESISANEGQYNLIIIDSKYKEISSSALKKITQVSNDSKTSVIINATNNPNTIFNYGGSYTYIDSRINEDVIMDAITKGTVFNGIHNYTVLQDCIRLTNGYILLPWDNRLEEFSISLDLEIENTDNNVGIICIAHNSSNLLSIIYDNLNKNFIVKSGNQIATYSTNNHIELSKSICKITITRYGQTLRIYCNDKLTTVATLTATTKGSELYIGKNNLAGIANSAIIRVSNLCLYNKSLNSNEVTLLNKGRFIFA